MAKGALKFGSPYNPASGLSHPSELAKKKVKKVLGIPETEKEKKYSKQIASYMNAVSNFSLEDLVKKKKEYYNNLAKSPTKPEWNFGAFPPPKWDLSFELTPPKPPTAEYDMPLSEPKTQKALGLTKLIGTALYANIGTRLPERETDFFVLPMDYKSFKSRASGSSHWPFFARPCPKTPRHGFVDSRKVHDAAEALNLFCETLRLEPEGELIMMRPLSGEYSAVATNAGITWGKGNDGVTASTSATFTYPFPMSSQKWNDEVFSRMSYVTGNAKSVGITDTAYIELVADRKCVIPVQIRNGPPQIVERNYIPKDCTPTYMVGGHTFTENDLLEWEEIIKYNSHRRDECFAWLPGASLSSHYAVHAIQAGIPVITDYEKPLPTNGHYSFKATDGAQKAPLGDREYRYLAQCLAYFADSHGLNGNNMEAVADYRDQSFAEAPYFAAGSVHAGTIWPNEDIYLKARAYGLVVLARYFVSACLGELRHWYRVGPGYFTKHPRTPLAAITPTDRVSYRNSVYEGAFKIPFGFLHSFISSARLDFREPGWNYRRSFGGRNWANGATAAKNLIEAIEAFALDPCEAKWTALIFTANVAMNVAHNGGKLLNKWVDDQRLDLISRCPTFAFMSQFAAKWAFNPPVVEALNPETIKAVFLHREPEKSDKGDWGGFQYVPAPDEPTPEWRAKPGVKVINPWKAHYAERDEDYDEYVPPEDGSSPEVRREDGTTASITDTDDGVPF